MSFAENELLAVAEFYGVDVTDEMSNEDIIAELDESGVTSDMWEAVKAEAQAQKEAAEKAVKKKPGRPRKEAKAPEVTFEKLAAGDVVLVKMVRQNPTYETNGHRFTKEHPYVAMSPDEAQDIFDNEEGFVLAGPREVQEYYS